MMGFHKTREEFAEKLEAHRQAVRIVANLLMREGHTIFVNADVWEPIWEDKERKYNWDLQRPKKRRRESHDVYDWCCHRIIEVTSTNAKSIYIGPKRLDDMVRKDATIFFVFWNLNEVRRIDAVQLKAQERHAFRRHNRWGEPVLIFKRELAEEIQK